MKDITTSIAVTEEAIEAVDNGAAEEWKAEALAAIERVAQEKEIFTPDDFWAYLSKPKEPRALGPVVRRAIKAGTIVPTGQFVCSEIPSHHRNPIRVYRSGRL